VRRVTPGLALLRATGVTALLLLLWNPATTRPLASDVQPIVLLDASLSMLGTWRAALDSARALRARRDAIVWRFGTGVAAFDTAPPADGASRLAPALEAAAARGGEVIVVTDGAVSDVAAIPPDLLRRPRVVVVPPSRGPFRDAFVASVEGQRRLANHDTVRLKVSYGTAGTGDAGGAVRDARIAVSSEGRSLVSKRVSLPDNGTVTDELTLPASRIPHPGWTVLEVRLEGVGDAEPRDDARRFVIEVSPQPAAVIFASPPDWETRFLARALGDVARVPVRTFVETEPGRWRDAATLAPVSASDLARAVQSARLVVLGGDPGRGRRYTSGRSSAAQLVWPSGRGQPGDWYLDRPAASPLAGGLVGIPWDSLPPALSAGEAPAAHDSGVMTALTARLARRGAPRAIVTLEEHGGPRRATVTASGLWRWAFRGGAPEEAYRSLVAALADWLLGERRAGRGDRAVPVTLEVPNGLPLVWRSTQTSGEPQPLVIDLSGERGSRTDTLRFDAAGRGELRLPPGVYRYALAGGAERGVVAVEQYSDEWRPPPSPPATPALAAQAGQPEGRLARVALRDRWWLYVIAIAALVVEWAWRRRQGLP
jgi:hypothetical protein